MMTIALDDKELHDKLNAAIFMLKKPTALLSKLKKYIHEETMKMFRGLRPDKTVVRGMNWKPLAESTIWGKRAAVKRGAAIIADRPLVRTGNMRDSIRVLSSSNSGFVYGSDARSMKGGYPYPGVHNLGGKNGRPPQRPWLFLTKTDYAQMLKYTRDYLVRLLKKAKMGVI